MANLELIRKFRIIAGAVFLISFFTPVYIYGFSSDANLNILANILGDVCVLSFIFLWASTIYIMIKKRVNPQNKSVTPTID